MWAGIAVADREGVDAVTMRRVGSELGVEGMALYRHFASKDELLDSMVDRLIGEIAAPAAGRQWRKALRARALAARKVFGHRRWAQRLLATRAVLGPGFLEHIEAVSRALRDGGFSYTLAHHATHILGARIFGFTQEPISDALDQETVQRFVALIRAGNYPAITEALPHVRHDEEAEFEFGLDLVLDALERARRSAATRSRVATVDSRTRRRSAGGSEPGRLKTAGRAEHLKIPGNG